MDARPCVRPGRLIIRRSNVAQLITNSLPLAGRWTLRISASNRSNADLVANGSVWPLVPIDGRRLVWKKARVLQQDGRPRAHFPDHRGGGSCRRGCRDGNRNDKRPKTPNQRARRPGHDDFSGRARPASAWIRFLVDARSEQVHGARPTGKAAPLSAESTADQAVGQLLLLSLLARDRGLGAVAAAAVAAIRGTAGLCPVHRRDCSR